jgi:hypothetical protein
MQKSIRSFAILAVLSLSVVPGVRAEQWGSNPHPQVVNAPSTLSIVYTVLSVLGL